MTLNKINPCYVCGSECILISAINCFEIKCNKCDMKVIEYNSSEKKIINTWNTLFNFSTEKSQLINE